MPARHRMAASSLGESGASASSPGDSSNDDHPYMAGQPRRLGAAPMSRLVPSLDAHRNLKATMTACSWQAGWRSLLLRAYVDPPEVDGITTAATADQLIVLVT